MKKGFWIVAALFTVSILMNVWQCNGKKPENVVTHDTIYKDTIIYTPTPAETITTGKTVYIRIPVKEYLPGDTVHDSIDVPVPIIQKRYDDSLYTAWVSGYNPALDSILIHQREVITTKTVVNPAPRLSVGIQTGAGIGIISHQPDVYVGIGVQWRINKR